MTADELTILSAKLEEVEDKVDHLEALVNGVREDVATVKGVLMADRDADRKMREKCLDLIGDFFSAYKDPGRGFLAMHLMGGVFVLLLAGTVTFGDLAPIISWWTGADAPAAEGTP